MWYNYGLNLMDSFPFDPNVFHRRHSVSFLPVNFLYGEIGGYEGLKEICVTAAKLVAATQSAEKKHDVADISELLLARSYSALPYQQQGAMADMLRVYPDLAVFFKKALVAYFYARRVKGKRDTRTKAAGFQENVLAFGSFSGSIRVDANLERANFERGLEMSEQKTRRLANAIAQFLFVREEELKAAASAQSEAVDLDSDLSHPETIYTPLPKGIRGGVNAVPAPTLSGKSAVLDLLESNIFLESEKAFKHTERKIVVRSPQTSPRNSPRASLASLRLGLKSPSNSPRSRANAGFPELERVELDTLSSAGLQYGGPRRKRDRRDSFLNHLKTLSEKKIRDTRVQGGMIVAESRIIRDKLKKIAEEQRRGEQNREKDEHQSLLGESPDWDEIRKEHVPLDFTRPRRNRASLEMAALGPESIWDLRNQSVD